jgi:carboxyl-terminal processing protease
MRRQDLYQPVVVEKKKESKVPLVLTVVILCLISFGTGFRAHEQNWLQVKSSNEANAGLPEDLAYDSVEEVYDKLRAHYDGQLTQDELLTGLKKGLAEASGDPYTVYFDSKETQEFYSDLNGSFEGIGAELGSDGDLVVVVAPIKGFPAEKAGLRPKDAILEIDGEDAVGITVEEAVKRIRGEAGTDVELLIARKGERLDITITRQKITIPSVESEILDGNIGYLSISRFAEDTAQLSRAAAEDFVKNNVKYVILDLRSNSGGYVDAGVEVASLWLNDEVVFEQRSGGKTEGVLNALGDPVLDGLDTVVLINEGSASASEIVAGALKDHGVATLVGKTSYGKGSVQQLDEFSDGSTLKVTIARWFTPDGVNIDKDGIKPDIDVEFTEKDFENGTDSQLDKAKALLEKGL